MSIATQIKELRKSKDLHQKEVAKKLGVKPGIISFWEKGKRTPNANNRRKLCSLFGITEPELFGSNPVKQPFEMQKVPIISWINANHFGPIDDPFPAGISDEYIYTGAKGEHIFALKVQNDCMEPEFVEGDIIVIKPNVQITSGDYVIIADREASSATFKQYKEYGTKKILHPLNPKYKDIELDHKKQYTIVGKIIEKIKKY